MQQGLGVAIVVVLSLGVGWWVGRTSGLDAGARERDTLLERRLEDLARLSAEQLKLLKEKTAPERVTSTERRVADSWSATSPSLTARAAPSPTPTPPAPAPGVESRVADIATDGAPSLGPDDASVTIVEFSDFQCPPCAAMSEIVHRVHRQYPERVRVVFKHNPLPTHESALLAHRAAVAAEEQGLFWEMSRMLFANQKNLDAASLRQYARTLNLDIDRFEDALAADETSTQVVRDIAEAKRLRVESVPSFFLNGRKLEGFQPFEFLSAEIETELARARRN